mmetsp:Transcript_9527/g.6876  ORF Transcript_9527/g.6876 Transcript_9527/m.6876 type:complete len:132 (-) Transcript_9527:957-1352(-)
MTGLMGVMITASHNLKQDNGLKIMDKDGSMLAANWEKLTEIVVNSKDLSKTLSDLSEGKIDGPHMDSGFDSTKGIFFEPSNMNGYVFLGKDTREHSSKLLEAVRAGVTLIRGKPHDFGLVTTPQLHNIVQR